MSRHRRAARIDENQPGIVNALRDIPGVSVEVDHDDILVGRNGRTYWFELKTPDAVSPVTGEVRPSELKQSQKDLLADWKGHYEVVWTLDQILESIA
jgi:hypothetical protein